MPPFDLKGCDITNQPKVYEVIIIGNGPSAICLSFLLSGYRPYYNGLPHSVPFLEEKLKGLKGKSVVESDLYDLAQGLEGRSLNPVAVLFDHMLHPDADHGALNPSLLTWVYDRQHEIPHLVLGKWSPGGSWQQMDGNLQTISISNWMELPSLPLQKWLNKKKTSVSEKNRKDNRATVADVRNYYCDFLKEKNIYKNFRNGYLVSSVQKVLDTCEGIDCESGEAMPCCQNVKADHKFLWEVRGHKVDTKRRDGQEPFPHEDFCFQSNSVVLATGTTDLPNRLGTTGENLPYVVHSLKAFEQMITKKEIASDSDPVVVVGAGLSAADAILMALENDISVAHVFRVSPNDSSLVFKKLPLSMYPEYHRVYSLMKGKEVNDLYKPYSRHQVEDLQKDNKVLIKCLKNSCNISTLNTSLAVVLIGAKPNLAFLPQEGKYLGTIEKQSIDSKHNPIQVDPFSYEAIKEPGMYAMGPLMGDNFVRFAIGGSLGITNHLIMKAQGK
ncbi:oxidative stress-induced growth inhibitor 2-like isoform X1 [Octopus sinensis]|uniref:Oxidative stress-induced growth inhibitor 2-like isoform X1 n=2 Tax=Octopus sinensis TaxID=2607531 RepID=A0A6P7TA39_9MOLL|nr:oxidative stress-induced growth inhibitor 2-like isoform X1 [Octopus sinensis]XP_029647874.1 oxidative stress-induced growth inhibitor 2-like isoform X1 [Octopus sinensis]XP_036366766.1 oxidative stress-induced growth inhibitor 2-like isoform X1 [Octopus sinensis]XP_036366767.1 oxidative stress-induced growth inhibitor 2-like isoform X1 [Octopus sinensis]